MQVLRLYLKQLSVSQWLTQKLLYVSPDNKRSDYNSHEHPGEDKAEADRTDHQHTKRKCKQALGVLPQILHTVECHFVTFFNNSRHQQISSSVGQTATCGWRSVFIVATRSTQHPQEIKGQYQYNHTANHNTSNPPIDINTNTNTWSKNESVLCM